MRISKRGVILIATILTVTGLAWLVWSWPPSRSRRLTDGSVLRVERVSFGKRDPAYMPGVSLWEEAKAKVAAVLPKQWAAKITFKKLSSNGTWWYNAKVHTNEDALHIWITQRDPTNGLGVVQASMAELVDEHGCVYQTTQSGGVQLPSGLAMGGRGPLQSAVTWFTFEAFPRHDARMRLRLYTSPWGWGGRGPSRELLAEFVILNPSPKPADPAKWATEPLPIERKYGDVSFVLKGVGFKTNWIEGRTNMFRGIYSANPVVIVPRFEVFERGKQLPESNLPGVPNLNDAALMFGGQTPEWEALEMDLSDSSGNFAPKQWGDSMSVFLSPREPAWKLAVKFFGSEQESSASNTVWVVRGVQVPGAAAYTAFTNEQDLDGVQLKPVALAGSGEAVYHDDELTQITGSNSATGNSIRFGTSFNRGYSYGGTEEIVDTVTPYLALRLGDMADDQRLTIRAVASGTNEYYAEAWRYGTAKPAGNWLAKAVAGIFPPNGGSHAGSAHTITYLKKNQEPFHLSYLLLDLPPEVKTVDLYFCIHRARTVEYVFKPPQP